VGLVNETQFQLAVLPGSDVFAQTGPYAQGVEVDVADSELVAVAKGCLAVHFINSNTVSLNCYGGQCGYSTRLGADLIPVDAGSQVTVQVGQAAGSGPAPIPLADHARYWQLLGPGSPGADDAKLCQLPNAPATQAARLQTAIAITQAAPTATATATEIVVVTPEESSTP
jgi:hypothetical protein